MSAEGGLLIAKMVLMHKYIRTLSLLLFTL